jgi:protein NrfD
MSWGAWILVAIYPAAILYGINATPFLRRANLILGIALGAYTGVLLATLGARALWGSLFLAPLFLVSGFSTAAALTMLLPIERDERETLRRWDLYAIVAEVVVLGLFFIDVATDERGRAAVAQFFGGPYTAAFFAFVIVIGLVAPFLLEIAESRRHLRAAALAPAFLLIGGFALRWIFVAAGQ